jgi:hypothetical protein
MTSRKHNIVDKASVGPQQQQWLTIIGICGMFCGDCNARVCLWQVVHLRER